MGIDGGAARDREQDRANVEKSHAYLRRDAVQYRGVLLKRALPRSWTFWLGLAVMAPAYGVAWGLRQLYVEPTQVALICNAASEPPWCAVRSAILFGQHNLLFGAAALAAGAAALFRGSGGLAVAAAGLSVIAIANYNVDMGALGLVLGLIASVGAGPRHPPDDARQA